MDLILVFNPLNSQEPVVGPKVLSCILFGLLYGWDFFHEVAELLHLLVCAWNQISSLPEWSPMRILTLTLGMCLILNVPMQDRMSRDMLAISAACRLPLRVGTPEATM